MSECTNQFEQEIGKVISYFRKEFDLTYATAIGVLELASYKLKRECEDEDEDEEEEEEDDDEFRNEGESRGTRN